MFEFEDFPERDLTPEIEIEGFRLFDEVQYYLTNAQKVETSLNSINRAHGIVRSEYQYHEFDVIASSIAAVYNPIKNVTAVIESEIVLVDDECKQAILLEFYRGAPFGYLYDPTSVSQFELRPGQVQRPQDPKIIAEIDRKIQELQETADASDPVIQAALSILQASKEVSLAAHPLQGACAIWDTQSNGYEHIGYDSYSQEHDNDIQAEDFISMRIWLNGANIALDIV